MAEAILTPILASELDASMHEARSWEVDREALRAKSERRAWTVAGAATLIAVLAVAAVVVMLPLKATFPVILYVDKTTGNTELVSAFNQRQVGYQDLNDKYWARQYVIARESYFYTFLQADYETVLALSNDDVGTVYDKSFAGENAKQVKLGASIEERVKVLSVVLLPGDPGKAVVRFEKTQRRVNTQDAGPPQTYVASLAFKYEPSMFGRERDLISNPLGFKVTAYRVDAEIASPGGQR